MIVLTEVASGRVLDRFDLSGDEPTYETGDALRLVGQIIDRFGIVTAREILADWSNGYLRTQTE